MNFTIKPLSPALGAEIIGLDLRGDLDGETVAALRAAWLDHLVLLFRGQTLSDADEVRVAGYFGEPFTNSRVQDFSGRDPHVLSISNIRKNGEPIGVLPDGELNFHSDSAFQDHPLMATVLYAVELPSHGGNTMFKNMYQVYDALDPAEQARLGNYQALNAYDYNTLLKTGHYDRDKSINATHPVIRTHPETGGKVLYVNRLMTEEIVGLPEAESDALLRDLLDMIDRREFIYDHVWRVGDLIIWDNRCTQHARTDFPADQNRLLKRVGITGDKPY